MASTTTDFTDDVRHRVLSRTLTIGANVDGSDALHGFLDDLRTYNVALSADEVRALYEDSAPILHFEFDEDEHATTFADSSVNGYTGLPTTQTCTSLNLNTLTINSPTTSSSDLYVALDNKRLITISQAAGGSSYDLNIPSRFCGQAFLEVGLSANDGTSSSVGGVNLEVVFPGRKSFTFGGGTDSLTLSWTVGTELSYVPNPHPGTDGQIGNTALLDGNGYITVEDADTVNTLTNQFTIMAWISPDDLSGTQRIIGVGQTNSVNGIGFGIEDDHLIYESFGSTKYSSSAKVDSNIWHHVAVVLDENNDANFYLDGVKIDTVAGSTPAAVNPDDPLYIGASGISSGVPSDPFIGQIDELAVYGRTMTEEEIFSIYLRELRWYQDSAISFITVDTDSPTIELLSDHPYRANGYIQLAVSALDGTSRVRLVDFGLKAPDDSDFTWMGVPLCGDAATTRAAWCPFFDSSQLGGDSEYQMMFRAVDTVGNQTTSVVYTLYVDDTAPTVSSSDIGNLEPIARDPSGELAWTISLPGDISDLDVRTGIPGSGVQSDDVMVSLVDSTGAILNGAAQRATIDGDTWSIDYAARGERPAGVYTITVAAKDKVGNEATTNVGAIGLDARPPTPEIYGRFWPDLISTTSTLPGTVSEQPIWGGGVAEYHFEEPDVSTIFYDSSGEENNAACIQCPTVADGLFGRALDFGGTNEYVVIPSVIDPASDTFTATAWFILADDATTRIILQQEDGTGTGRGWLYVTEDGNLGSFLGGSGLIGAPITTGQWYHAAVTYDGATLRLYLDGNPDTGDVRAMEPSDGDILLGIHKSLSEDFFFGGIDEVAIFDRTLSSREIYAMAQSQVSGVAGVELSLEPFDFETEEGTPNWQPATLNQPGANLSTWSYFVAEDLEDFYQIKIRGEDAFGNTSATGTVWRGIIDTLDPRISFSIEHLGGGNSAQTEYTLTVDDLFLDEGSLVQPCTENELALGHDGDSGVLNQITAVCKVAGHETDPVSVTACDAGDRCTTETVTPPTPTDVDGVAILTPTNQSIVTGITAATITGGAFATAGIADVTLSVNGSMLGTATFDGTVTDAPWGVTWTPPALGPNTLTAVMTDGASNTFTDTITITVLPNITVNSLNDPGDGTCDNTECTLREAIAAVTIGNIIGFDVTGTIILASGDLILNQDLTIEEPGTADLTIDGDNASRVFNISGGAVTIAGLTMANGNDSQGGGGVLNFGTLDLNESTISGNSSDSNGGGIINSGTLTLNITTISGNSATGNGGGIDNEGTLDLNNSTVNSNEAGGDGGGISNPSGSTLTMINTTVSGNSATGDGGGIWNDGTLTMNHSTVSDNSSGTPTSNGGLASISGAEGQSGGIWSDGAGEINIKNSIVANNLPGGDCLGSITPLGYNLNGDDSCELDGTGDLPNTDPLLDNLQHNGGHTFTHALLPGSPAIDAVPVEHCVDHEGILVSSDQRGIIRQQGEACDIGAYELTVERSLNAPVAVGDIYSVDEDGSLTMNIPGVLANDSDLDGDLLTAVLVDTTGNGVLTLNLDGSFSYSPAPNFDEIDSFTYVANDGANDSDPALVTITLNPTEDTDDEMDDTPPLISSPQSITVEGDAIGGTDKSNLDIQIFLEGTEATDLVDPNPVVTNDAPEVFQLGETVVTFIATDADGNRALAQSVVTVVDTIPPELTLPDNVTVQADDIGGIHANNPAVQGFLRAANAVDIVDAGPLLLDDAPERFPSGATVVTFTAIDASGNEATGQATVTVVVVQGPEPTTPEPVGPGPTPTPTFTPVTAPTTSPALTPTVSPEPTPSPTANSADGGGCNAAAGEGETVYVGSLLLGLMWSGMFLAGRRRWPWSK